MRPEDVLFALYVAGVILSHAALIGAIAYHVVKSRRTRAAIAKGDGLDQVASLLQGEVVAPGAGEPPFVRFAVEGTTCRLHKWMLFVGRPDVVTTVEGRIGFRGFLEATSRGASRYPTRSPRFRELAQVAGFRVVTTDPRWANEVLEGDLQALLGALGEQGRRVRVVLAADRFLVEFESDLRSDAAVALARSILPGIVRLGRAENLSAGVHFVGETTLTNQGRCPVCSQPSAAPDPPCPACRVLQHADCWAYWGRCGIFGCRGVVAISASRR